ncbi:MAG: DUF445 family protein [Alphaproteobacteria bacterium]|nr:DUF445 family protein [Alphaproteobacteria bacterium]
MASPPASGAGPAPETDATRAYIAMRRTASLLLVLMSGVFIAASILIDAHPAMGYVRAFAEAAMVGGLADWFAVTAIFRRPLGLPIPHTAVIPRSKERIAHALGDFIADNFLAESNVAARLKDQDLASAIARLLADERQAQRIADGLVSALPALLDTFDDAAMADFVRRQAAALAEDGRIAPTLGAILALMTDQGRHQALVDAGLEEAWRALNENEPAIRHAVRARTAWLWRVVGVDAQASNALIQGLETTLRDVAANRDHALRRRVTEFLHQVARDLQHSPALRAQIEAAAQDMLAHPAVQNYAGEVWAAAKASLRRQAEAEGSGLRVALERVIRRVGRELLEDEAARTALNERLRAALAALAGRYGRDASSLVTETILSWDSETITTKLEQNVGRDLQYVRINGTLIGGLIGLAIHQVALFLH